MNMFGLFFGLASLSLLNADRIIALYMDFIIPFFFAGAAASFSIHLRCIARPRVVVERSRRVALVLAVLWSEEDTRDTKHGDNCEDLSPATEVVPHKKHFRQGWVERKLHHFLPERSEVAGVVQGTEDPQLEHAWPVTRGDTVDGIITAAPG